MSWRSDHCHGNNGRARHDVACHLQPLDGRTDTAAAANRCFGFTVASSVFCLRGGMTCVTTLVYEYKKQRDAFPAQRSCDAADVARLMAWMLLYASTLSSHSK